MIKQHIPNALTSLNLAAGMAGILFVLDGQLEFGAYMVFLAAVFDFLDGFVARILKVSSEIGKQLDSLADMVTFGVLPAFILFSMIEYQTENQYLPYVAFLVGIFSALRLAKFNIDVRQSDRFIGVPTPANALLISTLPFLAEESEFFGGLLSNPFVLVGIGVVMSFLLVAELPLIALKFKDFSFSKNIFRYLVIAFSLISLIIFGIAGIPFAIIVYIALSFIEALITRNA
ncbi:CDP-diacylglycerol--serine O-phosphatidyltransferase [Cognataquiflexum aquatile]|uniref:CDP-diacylglycerol--serine O-phosphatidyltransferase n=1 Tax=Cognataquiflexum aquatile TaxID=2249427 RepID=UPI000DEAE2C2|nr:CDP-diacylglycerol--serine O-phosphatidyltransferase [Cognataquiflexum aquatile]